MIKPILSLTSLFLCLNSYAQIYLNPGVDTSFANVKTALHFYNNYVAEFKDKKLPEMAKYWPQSEMDKRKIPDQIIYALNDAPLYSQGLQLTIIYVRPTDQYVHIKTQFTWSDSSSKHVSTMAVANYYIGFDNKKQPYFINPMTINLARWHSKSVRNITFYYPAYHTFNIKKADSLINSIVKLENNWGLKPIAIRYYLADDNDELYKLCGFDYALLMGNILKPSGKSDDKDNQVFCGGLGENYFHEVVHVYLNHLYPKSPLQEGMAVFYGGTMGHTIKWHLKRVNQYLLKHPEANLNNLDDFWYTDPFTNPGSAIQGMICDLVYQKDGIAGLKKLMAYTSYKEIFDKEFHISADHINDFLRKTISNQANQ